MTKTLTEQWRDGTLPAGYYYIIANTKERNKVIFYLPENTNTDGAVIKGEVVNGEDGGWVLEVLGPVPDYMDCKGLIYDSINLADARKRIDELVSKTDKLVQKMHILEDKLREAKNALNLIEVHTGSIGQSEEDMNESLIAIMNICRKYFGEELK